MTKILTEYDEFTADIYVPEGSDSRDHAAEDVELIAQRLTNRTLHVNTHAAKRDQANTFTEQNVFAKTIESTTPGDAAVIRTGSEPNVLGSPWRVIESWKYAGGLYCESYAGANGGDTEGAFLIATNARWDRDAARWTLQNVAHDAVALIWHRGRLRVCRVAAGAAPWASWSTGWVVGEGAGGLAGFGATLSGMLRADNFISALNVTLTAPNGEVLYVPYKSRTKAIPLSDGYATDMLCDPRNGLVKGTPGIGVLFPVRPPHGAILHAIEAIVNQTTAATHALQLMKVTPNYGTPGIARALVGTSGASSAATGTKTFAADGGGATVDAALQYEVWWTPGNAADELYALRYTFEDPGPRNF